MVECQPTKPLAPAAALFPDWPAVQCAEDADNTLIDLWRKYAAHAAQPYALSAFRKEFRKWQSTAPVKPAAEYAASDRYWQGRASPRPDILVLDDAATLRARGGQLEIFSHRASTRFDAGPHHRKPKAIIFARWGGSFSIAATRFCVDPWTLTPPIAVDGFKPPALPPVNAKIKVLVMSETSLH